jgi:Ca-activated chloride channel family protein
MTWAHPALLLLAPLVLAGVAVAYRRAEQRRARDLERFGDPALLARMSPLADPVAVRRRGWMDGAALALAVVALARPQWGEAPAWQDQAGRDVLVLLDLSRSMLVSDLGTTRLEAARRAVPAILAASPGSRVGLVVFGGSAFLQLPLTGDRAALLRYLAAASPDDLGDPSTDIPAALALAARVFERTGERGFRTVVLLSDGETEGELEPALARLRDAEIPVLALGLGTVSGGPVPADSTEAPEPWHRDAIGRIALSRLEEDPLRRVADATGGRYARWDEGRGVAPLREALAQLAARPNHAGRATEPAERFQGPLALALGVLLLGPLAGRRRTMEVARRVACLALLALPAAVSGCDEARREAARGATRYRAGEFQGAYEAFRASLAIRGDPSIGLQAGNALYRLHRYEEAAALYRAYPSAPPLAAARLSYNLGNAYVRAAEERPGDASLLEDAVAAYEEALRLDPADPDAKWNLELALRRLADDRFSGGSAGRGRRGDYGRGNQNVPGYEGNPEQRVGAMAGGGLGSGEGESAEELSEAQARALLETVEREQLQSHEGRRARAGRSEGRDW